MQTLDYVLEDAETLHHAMGYLAARCDGAVTLDDQGFAAADSPAGKAIAALDLSEWTPGILHLAWELAQRYQGQLAAAEIAAREIPEPPRVGGGRSEAHQAYRHQVQVASRAVALDYQSYIFTFAYDAELVAAIRGLPAAHWNPTQRQWELARSPQAAVFATTCGFTPADEQTAAALAHDAATPVPPPPPQLPPVRYETKNGARVIVVEFAYTPDLVNAVKALPGARYDSRLRHWSLPASEADHAVGFAHLAGLEIGPELEKAAAQAGAKREAARAASTALDADLALPASLQAMRPFQRAGVAYVLAKRKALIGDQVGLGKTVQALAAVELAGSYPALVVCPASLKLNWRAEVAKWLPKRSTVVVAGTTPEPIETADIVIVNYDLLASRRDDLVAVRAKSLVMDECQAVKSPKAKRTKALRHIAEALPPNALRLGLSGTAILNRPAELIEPLRILGTLAEIAGTKSNFERRYCDGHMGRFGWEADGATHVDELHRRLRETCYVRRTKTDVMPELPPIQHASVPVELSAAGAREYAKIEADVVAYLAAKAAAIAAEQGEDPARASWLAAMRAASAEHLVRLNALRECVGRAKTPAAIQWVADWLAESDEKMILFAWHQSVQDALVEATGAPAILGAQSASVTEAAKKAFQEDPDCRLIVCSLAAASEGHTLTAAQAVTLVELPWTPARVEQAFGRAYGRLADAHSITGYRLLGAGTIDEDLSALLSGKEQVVSSVLDGAAPQRRASNHGVAGDLVVALARRGLRAG